MNVKLDENLPAELASTLKLMGHDVDTVQEEDLTGCPDAEIWRTAQAEGRFLITQDLDFSDVRRFAPGTHAGILLVRLSSPSRNELIERVGALFQTENVNGWRGCFVVATERKVRVIHPPRK
ncbi:MAG: DUF5615 family PIN-like protein [Acidobacteria bacterium]|nr:DUF5615 family PIN-like protein [Acidobacteriota bacterium]